MSDAISTQGSRSRDEMLHGLVVFGHGNPIFTANQLHVRAARRSGRKAHDVLDTDGDRRIGVTFSDLDKHGDAPRSGSLDLYRTSYPCQELYVLQPKVILDEEELSNV